MSAVRLPDIFIVGVQKAGTTSLYDWLAQHPAILGMAHTKDLPFFADDKLFAQGIDYFARVLPRITSEQYLMSGSVHYLFFPEALQRVREFCPQAKLLVMLRDPLERTVSAYRFALQRGLESRFFNQAITDELSNPNRDCLYTSKVDRFQKFYVARSLYGEQLLRLYRHYPAQQVFVGIFSDLVHDPDRFLTGVLDFLGLPKVPIETRRRNTTRGLPRSQLLSRLLFHDGLLGSPVVKLLKKAMPLPMRYRFRRTVLSLNTNRRRQPECEISETIRDQLRVLFRNDLEQLGTAEADRWIRIWGLGTDEKLIESRE